MIVVCECGERRPTQDVWDLWEFLLSPGHGHYPARVLFQCPCGEDLELVIRFSGNSWYFKRGASAEEISAWLNFHILEHKVLRQ